MTETFHLGIPSGRLHVLKPARQLPFNELASHARVGITPHIGKGGGVIVIFGEVGLLEYREALTLRGRRNSSGSLECCNWPFVKRQDSSAVSHDCG
jgi:hypothetical protein